MFVTNCCSTHLQHFRSLLIFFNNVRIFFLMYVFLSWIPSQFFPVYFPMQRQWYSFLIGSKLHVPPLAQGCELHRSGKGTTKQWQWYFSNQFLVQWPVLKFFSFCSEWAESSGHSLLFLHLLLTPAVSSSEARGTSTDIRIAIGRTSAVVFARKAAAWTAKSCWKRRVILNSFRFELASFVTSSPNQLFSNPEHRLTQLAHYLLPWHN